MDANSVRTPRSKLPILSKSKLPVASDVNIKSRKRPDGDSIARTTGGKNEEFNGNVDASARTQVHRNGRPAASGVKEDANSRIQQPFRDVKSLSSKTQSDTNRCLTRKSHLPARKSILPLPRRQPIPSQSVKTIANKTIQKQSFQPPLSHIPRNQITSAKPTENQESANKYKNSENKFLKPRSKTTSDVIHDAKRSAKALRSAVAKPNSKLTKVKSSTNVKNTANDCPENVNSQENGLVDDQRVKINSTFEYVSTNGNFSSKEEKHLSELECSAEEPCSGDADVLQVLNLTCEIARTKVNPDECNKQLSDKFISSRNGMFEETEANSRARVLNSPKVISNSAASMKETLPIENITESTDDENHDGDEVPFKIMTEKVILDEDDGNDKASLSANVFVGPSADIQCCDTVTSQDGLNVIPVDSNGNPLSDELENEISDKDRKEADVRGINDTFDKNQSSTPHRSLVKSKNDRTFDGPNSKRILNSEANESVKRYEPCRVKDIQLQDTFVITLSPIQDNCVKENNEINTTFTKDEKLVNLTNDSENENKIRNVTIDLNKNVMNVTIDGIKPTIMDDLLDVKNDTFVVNEEMDSTNNNDESNNVDAKATNVCCNSVVDDVDWHAYFDDLEILSVEEMDDSLVESYLLIVDSNDNDILTSDEPRVHVGLSEKVLPQPNTSSPAMAHELSFDFSPIEAVSENFDYTKPCTIDRA